MEGHRLSHRATYPTPVGGFVRLKYFAHFESTGLEVGPGKDLVVGDDM